MKALMEGIGPIAFAWLLPRFERTPLPGAPWLASCALMSAAFVLCFWLEACTDDAVHAHRVRACCDCSDSEQESSLLKREREMRQAAVPEERSSQRSKGSQLGAQALATAIDDDQEMLGIDSKSAVVHRA